MEQNTDVFNKDGQEMMENRKMTTDNEIKWNIEINYS